MSKQKMLENFLSNPPKTLKVYDKGLERNLMLDLTDEGDRYITRRNMGTSLRRVFHYWSFDRAFDNRVTS